MCREPCLDIAATLCRQFVVDVGVQFVFGDGDLRVGHGRYLCVISSVSLRRTFSRRPGGAIAPLIRAAVFASVLHYPSRRAEAGGATAPSASQFRTITAKPLRTDKGYVAYASHPHA